MQLTPSIDASLNKSEIWPNKLTNFLDTIVYYSKKALNIVTWRKLTKEELKPIFWKIVKNIESWMSLQCVKNSLRKEYWCDVLEQMPAGVIKFLEEKTIKITIRKIIWEQETQSLGNIMKSAINILSEDIFFEQLHIINPANKDSILDLYKEKIGEYLLNTLSQIQEWDLDNENYDFIRTLHDFVKKFNIQLTPQIRNTLKIPLMKQVKQYRKIVNTWKTNRQISASDKEILEKIREYIWILWYNVQ